MVMIRPVGKAQKIAEQVMREKGIKLPKKKNTAKTRPKQLPAPY